MMLFVQALCALFAYDVICACCRFETIHSMVRRWKVARKNRHAQDALERVCSAVNYACIWYPETGALSAALVRHDLSAA